jgi:hypothetical protein
MPTMNTPRRNGPHVRKPGGVLLSLLLASTLGSALVGCGGAAPPAMAPEAPAAHQMTPMDAPAPPAPSPGGMAEPGDVERASVAGPVAPGASAASSPAPVAAPGRPAAKAAADGSTKGEIADAPMVVYQGELALRVDAGQGAAAIDSIVTLAESIGGHLAGRDDGRVVVKVPSRRFREAMSQVDAAFEVERRNVKAEDVTAEFKDLEVRLENLRATRKRLEQLLERSGTLADTLTVEKELERVAGEIDRIQGRIRFLRNHTSFSTLTVAVVERAKSTPVIAVNRTAPPRRELALPVAWVERVGVGALVDIPLDE